MFNTSNYIYFRVQYEYVIFWWDAFSLKVSRQLVSDVKHEVMAAWSLLPKMWLRLDWLCPSHAAFNYCNAKNKFTNLWELVNSLVCGTVFNAWSIRLWLGLSLSTTVCFQIIFIKSKPRVGLNGLNCTANSKSPLQILFRPNPNHFVPTVLVKYT